MQLEGDAEGCSSGLTRGEVGVLGVSGQGRGAVRTQKGWRTQRPPVEMKRIFLYFHYSVITYISQFGQNLCR
jgi:hypothetical protein